MEIFIIKMLNADYPTPHFNTIKRSLTKYFYKKKSTSSKITQGSFYSIIYHIGTKFYHIIIMVDKWQNEKIHRPLNTLIKK